MKKIGRFIFGCIPAVAAIFIMYMFVFGVAIAIGVKGAFVFGQELLRDGSVEMLTEYIINKLINSNVQMILNMSIMLALCVVFGFWYQKQFIKEKFSLKRIGSKAKELFSWRTILYLLLMGAGLQIVVSLFLEILLPMFPQTMENYSRLIDSIGVGNSVGAWIYTVLLAPVAEELIFRGVTLKLQRRAMGFAAANVVQAVLFGLYHQNVVQFVYAFLLGMLLGYLCYLVDSVLPAIALHASVNLFANILSATGILNWSSSLVVKLLLVSVASTITSVSLFLIVIELNKRKEQRPDNYETFNDSF